MARLPKCPVCKNEFVRKYSSLQKTCENIACAIEFSKGKAARENKKTEKLLEAQAKEKTKGLKFIATNWKKELQKDVQKIARLIDYGLPCLATGKTEGQAHGGHLYSKGSHAECRFNLHNIHRQSSYSNTYQSHDTKMWEGLEYEYGREYYEMVKSLKGGPIPKLSDKEYQELHYKALGIIARLEINKEDGHSKEERIALRTQINQELGIYK